MLPFLKNIFNNGQDEQAQPEGDNDIIVIKKPPPNVCGGTYETQRKSAPTEIESDDMTSFSAECSFRCVSFPDDIPDEERITFLSAFAVKVEGGSFLVLNMQVGYYGERTPPKAAYIGKDIFPELVALVKEHKLAKNNGRHSNTAGLPENFGGEVDIRYASGERIDYSNNQCPILSLEATAAIAKVFDSAFENGEIPLPDADEIEKIIFDEKRKNGGFTIAELTIKPDGTGVNKKQSRYDDPDKVFESEKDVDNETITLIRQNINACKMLAWGGIPDNGYPQTSDKKLTFVLKDGREFTAKEGRLLPHSAGGGFFNIELEMTTKH